MSWIMTAKKEDLSMDVEDDSTENSEDRQFELETGGLSVIKRVAGR
jgi:hypothetical protein